MSAEPQHDRIVEPGSLHSKRHFPKVHGTRNAERTASYRPELSGGNPSKSRWWTMACHMANCRHSDRYAASNENFVPAAPDPHSGPRRAKCAKKTLLTSRGLRWDIKGGARDWFDNRAACLGSRASDSVRCGTAPLPSPELNDLVVGNAIPAHIWRRRTRQRHPVREPAVVGLVPIQEGLVMSIDRVEVCVVLFLVPSKTASTTVHPQFLVL